MQSSYQQRQERERKDMEQAHMKIVKQLESRLYEMEGVNKVGARSGFGQKGGKGGGNRL